MSFLYPRTVKFVRPQSQTGVGFQAAYGGDDRADENVIIKSVPASVQLTREGTRSPTNLPGDGTASFWNVLTPRSMAATLAVVRDRDQMIDDLGRRFQVVGDYTDSMGAKLRVQRLEA